MKIIMCKYRNEYGRKMRKVYESHRGGVRRCECKSYQCRPNRKCGTVMTAVQDNLLLMMYERGTATERK
jgi:hypothetical protein